jgi:RecA-family ATPase
MSDLIATPQINIINSPFENLVNRHQFTLSDLMNTNFPEPEWIVEGLLPVGLSSLGGRPKAGKSLLSLQLAYAVAYGGPFLGMKTTQRSVLYIALEDSPRRMKSRNIKQGNIRDVPLNIELKWDPFDAGGKELLLYTIRDGSYGLIIVDTIGRLFGNMDQLDNSQMSCLYGDLQTSAQEYDVSLLLVDHLRKQKGFEEDPIEDLLGSTGKSAPLDTIFGLYRSKNDSKGKLVAKGRDIEEKEIELFFNKGCLKWDINSQSNIPLPGSRKLKVLECIEELIAAGTLATPSTISKRIHEDLGNVGHDLTDLVADDLIYKGEKIGKLQPYYFCEVEL